MDLLCRRRAGDWARRRREDGDPDRIHHRVRRDRGAGPRAWIDPWTRGGGSVRRGGGRASGRRRRDKVVAPSGSPQRRGTSRSGTRDRVCKEVRRLGGVGRPDRRLQRLIDEADSNPKDAAKQSALLHEFNKFSQLDVAGNRKAVIHVPYRLQKAYKKVHVKLVRELEKKFSGKALAALHFSVAWSM